MADWSASEILDWMEESCVGVLLKAEIQPNMAEPEKTRRAANAAGDREQYAAFIFQHIQALRVADTPDWAAQLGLTTMFVYMEAVKNFGWDVPRIIGSRKGGASLSQKADKKWKKWEKHFPEVQDLGSHKAAEVIKGLGCPYALSSIKNRLKRWSEAQASAD